LLLFPFAVVLSYIINILFISGNRENGRIPDAPAMSVFHEDQTRIFLKR